MRRKTATVATGTCSECNKKADFKLEDFGIGSYEFCGDRGTHHDWQWVSVCCEAQDDGDLEIEELEPEYNPY